MDLAESIHSMALEAEGKGWLVKLNQQVTPMAHRTLELIHAFLAKQITVEGLSEGLREMNASDLLTRHWKALTSEPEAAPTLEILQMIAFLPDQAEYQVARYGSSSLADDRDQLFSSLSRIT